MTQINLTNEDTIYVCTECDNPFLEVLPLSLIYASAQGFNQDQAAGESDTSFLMKCPLCSQIYKRKDSQMQYLPPQMLKDSRSLLRNDLLTRLGVKVAEEKQIKEFTDEANRKAKNTLR